MASSPRSAATTERRSGRWAEAERNDILVLEAARRVFSTGGPDAPVAAVAREAGVGMGTLYRRYGSKEELLLRLWMLSMEQTREEAEAAVAEHSDPFAALSGFVQRLVDAKLGALSAIGAVPMTDDIRASLAAVYEAVNEILERGRAAGQVRAEVTAVDVLWIVVLFANPPILDADRLLAYTLDGLRPPA